MGSGRRDGRAYSLAILKSLEENDAIVPVLWFYEVGNGLTNALRRKRITSDQLTAYLGKLAGLPIHLERQEPEVILSFSRLAMTYGLTNYDAAYLDLAMRLNAPLATMDMSLRRAAHDAGVELIVPSKH